jgi:hypothetical protein
MIMLYRCHAACLLVVAMAALPRRYVYWSLPAAFSTAAARRSKSTGVLGRIQLWGFLLQALFLIKLFAITRTMVMQQYVPTLPAAPKFEVATILFMAVEPEHGLELVPFAILVSHRIVRWRSL